MFIAAFFTRAKIWKQTKCPLVDEWMNNKEIIYKHIYNGLLAIKRMKSCHLDQHRWTKWNKSDWKR